MKQFFKVVFGSALGFLFAIFFLSIISFFTVIVAIAYSSSPQKVVNENSVLHLELQGVISERVEENPFSSFLKDYEVKETGLNDIMKAIDKAKEDSNIEGIFIDMKGLSAGSATIEEIRNALKKFKESGKFILAYGDIVLQQEYLLGTVADKVIINPIGMINLCGLSSQRTFYKGMLEKVGIEMQIIKVGTFKSAVEPYILDKMSDPNREQVTAYVTSIWSDYTKELSASRNLSVEKINELADNFQLFKPADSYREAGLVDEVMYRTDVEKLLKEMTDRDDNEKLRLVSVSDMCNAPVPMAPIHKDKVAVFYAFGEIDGTDKTSGINSKKFIKELKKIKENKEIKAVVVRINSPGGSAFGSEQMWKELNELKSSMPVVISMGDVAASGGYYMACMGDRIFAQPNTLTGSIGVFGMIPNTKGLAEKVGLSFDEVNTNKFSGFPALTRALTPEERDIMQAHTNRFYELFVKRCADGRGMTPDQIKAIAEGRVWSGRQALENKLVDELGGLEDAIAYAAQKAELGNYNVMDFPKKKEMTEIIMEQLGQGIDEIVAKAIMGKEYQMIQTLRSFSLPNSVHARLPYDITIK